MYTPTNYSIIIPHRNSPTLLKRCLDSIPLREDIQTIVVDDASNNTAPLHELAQQYPHVKFIYEKEWKGAGHARNIGIKHSAGKWILFADADDFFCKGFDKEIDRYLSSDADIVFFDVCYRYSENLLPCPSRYPLISDCIYRKDIEKLKWYVYVVWGKLYSGEIIRKNHLIFDETKMNDDVIFAIQANIHAKTYLISPFILYCNTLCIKSIQFSLNEEKLDCSYNVFLRLNRLLYSIDKQKYQYNLLRVILKYWRWIGSKACLRTFFKHYIPDTTLQMKIRDFRLSLSQIPQHLSKAEREKRRKVETINHTRE